METSPYLITNTIDPFCYPAFLAAAETLNFTEAAKLAGMTQSGVSQHIAKLEAALGSPVFHRIGKKVALNETGKLLLHFIRQQQEVTESFLGSVQSHLNELQGSVRYAMPESCLLSPHFALLLKDKNKHFPRIQLSVNLHSSDVVLEKILSDEIDFGFVTKKTQNSDLNFIPFCPEEYVLASAQNVSSLALPHQPWVNYTGLDVLIEHFSAKRLAQFKIKSLKYGCSTNSLNAALTLVSQGAGISIFPKHCIESGNISSPIKIHKTPNSCINTIYIATLANHSTPKRVERVIQSFLGMK